MTASVITIRIKVEGNELVAMNVKFVKESIRAPTLSSDKHSSVQRILKDDIHIFAYKKINKCQKTLQCFSIHLEGSCTMS